MCGELYSNPDKTMHHQIKINLVNISNSSIILSIYDHSSWKEKKKNRTNGAQRRKFFVVVKGHPFCLHVFSR